MPAKGTKKRRISNIEQGITNVEVKTRNERGALTQAHFFSGRYFGVRNSLFVIRYSLFPVFLRTGASSTPVSRSHGHRPARVSDAMIRVVLPSLTGPARHGIAAGDAGVHAQGLGPPRRQAALYSLVRPAGK